MKVVRVNSDLLFRVLKNKESCFLKKKPMRWKKQTLNCGSCTYLPWTWSVGDLCTQHFKHVSQSRRLFFRSAPWSLRLGENILKFPLELRQYNLGSKPPWVTGPWLQMLKKKIYFFYPEINQDRIPCHFCYWVGVFLIHPLPKVVVLQGVSRSLAIHWAVICL